MACVSPASLLGLRDRQNAVWGASRFGPRRMRAGVGRQGEKRNMMSMTWPWQCRGGGGGAQCGSRSCAHRWVNSLQLNISAPVVGVVWSNRLVPTKIQDRNGGALF